MSWRVIEEGDIPSLPIGLLKSALRVHHDADDDLLRHLTQVAKQYIETYTQTILGNVRLEVIMNIPSTGVLTLPTGPIRCIESVSVRNPRREWTQIPLGDVNVVGHRVHLTSNTDAQQMCIIGRGGITTISPLIEGTWLNLVKALYENETVEMSIIHQLLKPLSYLKVKSLV